MRMPDDEAGVAAMRAAAMASGRRVVEVRGPAGERGLALVWQQESLYRAKTGDSVPELRFYDRFRMLGGIR